MVSISGGRPYRKFRNVIRTPHDLALTEIMNGNLSKFILEWCLLYINVFQAVIRKLCQKSLSRHMRLIPSDKGKLSVSICLVGLWFSPFYSIICFCLNIYLRAILFYLRWLGFILKILKKSIIGYCKVFCSML